MPNEARKLVMEGAPGALEPDRLKAFDWVVDAVDSISPKLAIIDAAQKAGLNIVSSMGAGKL